MISPEYIMGKDRVLHKLLCQCDTVPWSIGLSVPDYGRETLPSFTKQGVHVSQHTGAGTSRPSCDRWELRGQSVQQNLSHRRKDCHHIISQQLLTSTPKIGTIKCLTCLYHFRWLKNTTLTCSRWISCCSSATRILSCSSSWSSASVV